MMPLLLAFAASATTACLPVRSDRIFAGDIAQAIPAFQQVGSDSVLSYAPQPGFRRVFHRLELSQILRQHGVQADGFNDVCFEWPVRPLSRADALGAMISALGDTSASVTILELSRQPVPAGRLEFPRAGLRRTEGAQNSATWKGFVEYAPGRRISVWALVEVRMPFTRVVAARPIRPGERIDASSVTIETGQGFPQNVNVLQRVEDAVGHSARTAVAAGSAVTASALTQPPAVVKGDVLQVDVLTGTARVSFEATAQSNGTIGQYVGLRNPQSRKSFRAQVTAPGRAVVRVEN